MVLVVRGNGAKWMPVTKRNGTLRKAFPPFQEENISHAKIMSDLLLSLHPPLPFLPLSISNPTSPSLPKRITRPSPRNTPTNPLHPTNLHRNTHPPLAVRRAGARVLRTGELRVRRRDAEGRTRAGSGAGVGVGAVDPEGVAGGVGRAEGGGEGDERG